MADFYLSDTGSATAPYDTWAKAGTLGATVVAAMAAGDSLWIDSDHQETTVGIVQWVFPGTQILPNRVMVVDKDNSDAYQSMADATGYIKNTNVADDMVVTGSYFISGIFFESQDHMTFGSTAIASSCELVDCKLGIVGSNNTLNFIAGATHNGGFTLRDTLLTTAGASTGFVCNKVSMTMIDCKFGVTGGGTWDSELFLTAEGANIECWGLDVSETLTTTVLVDVDAKRSNIMFFGNKYPAGWTGSLLDGTVLSPGTKVDAYSDDVQADGSYKFELNRYNGQVIEDTTTVRTGGGTYDGTNLYSIKMTAFANQTMRGVTPLRIPIGSKWIGTANQTLTVHIAHTDAGSGTSGDLLNTEFWIEAISQQATNESEAVVTTSLPANINAGSDLTDDSGETWGGTPGDEQKVSVVIAGSVAGYHNLFACFAPQSATDETVYVDRKYDVA